MSQYQQTEQYDTQPTPNNIMQKKEKKKRREPEEVQSCSFIMYS